MLNFLTQVYSNSMLTKDDLSAIRVIVQNEVQKETKPINKRLKKIEKDLSVTITFFDDEHLHLVKRVDRIENHVGLSPLPR